MSEESASGDRQHGESELKAQLADALHSLRVLEDLVRSKNMHIEQLERSHLAISKVLQVRDDFYTQLQIINVFDTDDGKVIYVG